MSFNLESSHDNEINEVPEVEIDSEQLSQTEETAENFDDCSLNEVRDSKGNEVSADSLEKAEEDYDDCEAKVAEMEEEHPELAEDDYDDFNDCGKETEGQYTAEVTYTTDGEVSQEEAEAELQEAYNECDDPEDMQQLKENANENEHIQVYHAEVVERPEDSEAKDEITEAEYEAAQEELDEAQENLEAQQEAAQEYQDNLENQINNHKDEIPQGNENIEDERSEENESVSDERFEGTEETMDSEGEEKVDENTESEEINETLEDERVEDTAEETEQEHLESPNDDALENESFEEQDANTDQPSETAENHAEDVTEESSLKGETPDFGNMEQVNEESKVESSNDNRENVNEGVSQKNEGEEDSAISDESQKPEQEEVSDAADSESIDNDTETLPDETVENEGFTEDAREDQVAEGGSEQASENLPKENVESIADETDDSAEDAGEDKKEEKENLEEAAKTTDEIEAEQAEMATQQAQLSLQERINKAFESEEVSADEINKLKEEYAAELEAKVEERDAIEAQRKNKFDEVLSKEKGSEEYKQALQEYNALQDQKMALDEQVAEMGEQRDLLEKKSLALRDAQIQKGAETMAVSAVTLAGVDELQERYDQAYYDVKSDKSELASIREDSCSAIKELSAEKDSIKQAMEAKMDQISNYVISNNMDRYETANDPHYQKLSQEYLAMKESYDKIGYSIVKLDENNKAITEQLGDEYVSMVELPPRSRISEVNIGTDVPGETNYFLDEAKASEVLSPFKQGNWEQLTIQEQKQAVEKLADYNAEILGVEDRPIIRYYYKEDASDYGGFSERHNTIYINEYNMRDAAETADTVSHEYRHKYQHERAEKLETQRDLEFKDGFDNYIRAEDDYQGYKEQLVEADARAYAEVIQDEIDSNTEITPTDTEQTVKVEGSTPAFADINPEKGAVWDASTHSDNFKKTELPVSDAQEATSMSFEHRGFLTNDGERITYEEAVNRITENAEKYMSSLNVSDDVKSAVVADMRSELYKQHLEAESRGLGDHGIRHIYGNVERGEQYLASRSDISDEQKLAVLVAQVYHDEGYTVSPNNLGTLNEGNSDIAHDKASVEIWNEPERQKIYKQVFTNDTLDSIKVAIGEHNSGKIDEVQSNTAIDTDPVVSTVHVCDKLALSQREKFSELLTSDPKLVELTESMNSTLKTLQDDRLGFYENGQLTPQGKKLLDDYHQAINAHIDSKGYDTEYAQRLKEAVNKDVGFNSGKFSSRMNYIYTPSDCYQYNPETGRNEITVFVIEHSDSTSKDLSYKQVNKLFEDLGLSDSEIELAKANGGYDFGATRGLSVKIEPITEDDIRQIEAARFQENNDLKEVNECIEAGRRDYKELSQKLTEIVALTDGEDLSYNTYCEVAFRGGIVVDFDENEFDSYSPAEKEQLVRNVVSSIVLSNTSNILDKRKG